MTADRAPQTDLDVALGAFGQYVDTGDDAYLDNLTGEELRELAKQLGRQAREANSPRPQVAEAAGAYVLCAEEAPVSGQEVAEAIRRLQAAETELTAELDRIRRALSTLTTPTIRPREKSLAARVIALIDEESRGWTAREIAEEYQQRGEPIHIDGPDPTARIRTALYNAVKNGRAYKADGRYWTVIPDHSGRQK